MERVIASEASPRCRPDATRTSDSRCRLLVSTLPRKFNLSVLHRLLAPVATAARNENLRRVEFAWGAAIGCRMGALRRPGHLRVPGGRGQLPSGSPVSCGSFPAAVIAPFAASLGDRFRRERFLLAMALVGRGRSRGNRRRGRPRISARLVFALAAVVGLSTTLIRPALQALASTRRRGHPRGADRGERRHVNHREHRNTRSDRSSVSVVSLSGTSAVVFAFGAGAFLAAALLVLTRVRRSRDGGGEFASAEDGYGREAHARGRVPGPLPPRERPRLLRRVGGGAGLRPRLPERPDRRRGLPGSGWQ